MFNNLRLAMISVRLEISAWVRRLKTLNAIAKAIDDVVERRSPELLKPRDWQIDFGPIEGKKGDVKWIVVTPEAQFQGQKLVATDTFENPGHGTAIRNILVGYQAQRPVTTATPTFGFAATAIGNGVKWQWSKLGQNIRMEVIFLEDCTFDATCFGRAVIE